MVGAGTPILTARLGARAVAHRRQQEIAEEILSLWEAQRPITAILRGDAGNVRRSVLLLGVRLRDEKARTACMDLVRLAADEVADDATLIDAWTAMVSLVAAAYRGAE